MKEYDALVVGAGILGLSTACYLKLRNPRLQVLVVDKLGAAGRGSTAKSAAAFRCFFSSGTNYALANSSVEFYRDLQKDLEVDLKLRWCGYLWCFTEETYLKVRPVLRDLSNIGCEYREYEEEGIAEALNMRTRFEDDEEARKLGLGNVYKGVFVPKAGLIGVPSLVAFYEAEYLKMGGEVQYNAEVTDLIVEPQMPLGLPGEPYFWQDAAVVGAKTNRGEIRAKKTVVAAGPWAAQLLDSVGVECFVKPKKRQVFSVKAGTQALKKLLATSEFSNAGCLPLTILPHPSVYIRPDLTGDAFWVSYADDFPRAFKLEEQPKPEENFYRHGLLPVMAKYLPQFKDSQPSAAFAGLYEINTLDGQLVVFEENGLLVVGGASGSGIMKADALGRIAAALYFGEEYALLYGDRAFKVSDLGLKNRNIEPEKLVI
jgi:glycine/D-amino acid oxidase-like deaminating enzyme